MVRVAVQRVVAVAMDQPDRALRPDTRGTFKEPDVIVVSPAKAGHLLLIAVRSRAAVRMQSSARRLVDEAELCACAGRE